MAIGPNEIRPLSYSIAISIDSKKYISDIAGQDIHSHEEETETLINELSTWLRLQPGGKQVGGGASLFKEYNLFRIDFPKICGLRNLLVTEPSFSDMNDIVTQYVLAL